MTKFVKHTSHMMVLGGIPTMVPNRTDEVDTGSPHWCISYNNRDTKIYGCDTTALVIGQGELFLILNGDHRQAFKDLIDNQTCESRLSRCLTYVRNNLDKLNQLSDNPF